MVVGFLEVVKVFEFWHELVTQSISAMLIVSKAFIMLVLIIDGSRRDSLQVVLFFPIA
jgi:hypothetical protein